jgi:hypothetical protein
VRISYSVIGKKIIKKFYTNLELTSTVKERLSMKKSLVNKIDKETVHSHPRCSNFHLPISTIASIE